MIQTQNLNLSEILNQWGLQVKSAEPIKDVFKVKTDQGWKNLKVSPLIPQRLLFVHQAIEHLNGNGFDKMTPLIPSRSGNTYLCDGTHAYSLFDWIEGRQCNFKNQRELIRSTKILAEFHQKSLGFTPPDNSNMRNRLGKCLKHFEERYQDLLDYQAIARSMPNDPFARIYLENAGFFLPMAVAAIDKLSRSSYPNLVEWAQRNKPFCHGDPAARNFILTPNHQIFMIDFDSCRLDLPIMDLIKFTRRVLKKYHWRFSVAKLVIDSYQEIQPLSRCEMEVMKAVFYFPQKFWRMSNRYFHEHGRHTPERALDKFQKYLQNKYALAQFQVEFERYQSYSGLEKEIK
jgi:CotS family spore coat protein